MFTERSPQIPYAPKLRFESSTPEYPKVALPEMTPGMMRELSSSSISMVTRFLHEELDAAIIDFQRVSNDIEGVIAQNVQHKGRQTAKFITSDDPFNQIQAALQEIELHIKRALHSAELLQAKNHSRETCVKELLAKYAEVIDTLARQDDIFLIPRLNASRAFLAQAERQVVDMYGGCTMAVEPEIIPAVKTLRGEFLSLRHGRTGYELHCTSGNKTGNVASVVILLGHMRTLHDAAPDIRIVFNRTVEELTHSPLFINGTNTINPETLDRLQQLGRIGSFENVQIVGDNIAGAHYFRDTEFRGNTSLSRCDLTGVDATGASLKRECEVRDCVDEHAIGLPETKKSFWGSLCAKARSAGKAVARFFSRKESPPLPRALESLAESSILKSRYQATVVERERRNSELQLTFEGGRVRIRENAQRNGKFDVIVMQRNYSSTTEASPYSVLECASVRNHDPEEQIQYALKICALNDSSAVKIFRQNLKTIVQTPRSNMDPVPALVGEDRGGKVFLYHS